ncbi:MarR family transcriptional regulator [Streptomyces sp. NPDC046977]|uniref:MarR family winged helix-turn-helix transcriptional regulator n=1 Tax=Streptomyces sp. NPDC046977 TaxID=3154703 RepID=UPI0033FAF84C
MSEFAVERARRIIQGRRAAAKHPPGPPGGPGGRSSESGAGLPGETTEFVVALHIMYARIRQFDEWLRSEYQLNLTELHVLSALSTVPRPVPRGAASRLAEEVELSPSGLTRLVDRLVERELLLRVPDPWDKRVTRLALTERGRQVRDTVVPRAAEHIRAACQGHMGLLDRLRRITETARPMDERHPGDSSEKAPTDPRGHVNYTAPGGG